MEHLPAPITQKGVAALLACDNNIDTPLKRERAAAVRRTAQRLRLALDQVAELTTRIQELATASGLAPLTTVVRRQSAHRRRFRSPRPRSRRTCSMCCASCTRATAPKQPPGSIRATADSVSLERSARSYDCGG